MTLRGDVRVNGQKIAEWSAVRRSDANLPAGTFEYRCEYVGVTMAEHHEFRVFHCYADGVAALGAAVLGKVATLNRIEKQRRLDQWREVARA